MDQARRPQLAMFCCVELLLLFGVATKVHFTEYRHYVTRCTSFKSWIQINLETSWVVKVLGFTPTCLCSSYTKIFFLRFLMRCLIRFFVKHFRDDEIFLRFFMRFFVRFRTIRTIVQMLYYSICRYNIIIPIYYYTYYTHTKRRDFSYDFFGWLLGLYDSTRDKDYDCRSGSLPEILQYRA